MALVYTHSASTKNDKKDTSEHMLFSDIAIYMLFQESIIKLEERDKFSIQIKYILRSRKSVDQERNTGMPEQLLYNRKQKNIQDFDT